MPPLSFSGLEILSLCLSFFSLVFYSLFCPYWSPLSSALFSPSPPRLLHLARITSVHHLANDPALSMPSSLNPAPVSVLPSCLFCLHYYPPACFYVVQLLVLLYEILPYFSCTALCAVLLLFTCCLLMCSGLFTCLQP